MIYNYFYDNATTEAQAHKVTANSSYDTAATQTYMYNVCNVQVYYCYDTVVTQATYTERQLTIDMIQLQYKQRYTECQLTIAMIQLLHELSYKELQLNISIVELQPYT